MSSPTSPTARSRSASWQEKLNEHCRSAQLHPPVFNIVSDRRGGRTAWSSTVTIPISTPSPGPSSPYSPQPTHHTISARYWYDGQYVHNAKEDAAEVALRTLTTGGAVGAGGGISSNGSGGASAGKDWGNRSNAGSQGSQGSWTSGGGGGGGWGGR